MIEVSGFHLMRRGSMNKRVFASVALAGVAASVVLASPALADGPGNCNPGNLMLVAREANRVVNHCYSKSGEISIKLPHVIKVNPGRHSGYLAYNKPDGTIGYHAFHQWQTDELGKDGLNIFAIHID
jgi:hypothetical protein